MRVLAPLLALGLQACAHLAPYERATLMTRVMQEPIAAMEASADEHVLVTRETQRGASRSGGASCGCR